MKNLFVLSILDDILNFVERVTKSPIGFFQENYQNPFMWLGFFFLGLLIFNITYSALQKEK